MSYYFCGEKITKSSLMKGKTLISDIDHKTGEVSVRSIEETVEFFKNILEEQKNQSIIDKLLIEIFLNNLTEDERLKILKETPLIVIRNGELHIYPDPSDLIKLWDSIKHH